MLNRLFGKKIEQTEVSVFGTGEESQDDTYNIPLLHVSSFPMSPELVRRKREEELRKKYGIEGLKNRN